MAPAQRVNPNDVPLVQVTTEGHALAFPPVCCCCGQPAGRQVEQTAERSTFLVAARRVQTLKVRVPSCAVCAPRLEWANHGGVLGLIPTGIGCALGSLAAGLVAGVPLAFLIAALVGSLRPSAPAVNAVAPLLGALPLVVGLVVFGAWIARQVRRWPRGPLGPEHVCARVAVCIRRFDGDRVTLGFARDRFAFAFVELNRGRITDVRRTTLLSPVRLDG